MKLHHIIATFGLALIAYALYQFDEPSLTICVGALLLLSAIGMNTDARP